MEKSLLFSSEISKMAPGNKFREIASLREYKLREKRLPYTQFIVLIKIFLFFPIVKFVEVEFTISLNNFELGVN